jgi:hypothetical protein
MIPAWLSTDMVGLSLFILYLLRKHDWTSVKQKILSNLRLRLKEIKDKMALY